MLPTSSPLISMKGSIPFFERNLHLWSTFWESKDYNDDNDDCNDNSDDDDHDDDDCNDDNNNDDVV